MDSTFSFLQHIQHLIEIDERITKLYNNISIFISLCQVEEDISLPQNHQICSLVLSYRYDYRLVSEYGVLTCMQFSLTAATMCRPTNHPVAYFCDEDSWLVKKTIDATAKNGMAVKIAKIRSFVTKDFYSSTKPGTIKSQSKTQIQQTFLMEFARVVKNYTAPLASRSSTRTLNKSFRSRMALENQQSIMPI